MLYFCSNSASFGMTTKRLWLLPTKHSSHAATRGESLLLEHEGSENGRCLREVFIKCAKCTRIGTCSRQVIS